MSLQFKRSSTPGVMPTVDQLEVGEIALNLSDQEIYTRDAADNIINIGFSKSVADSEYVLRTGGVLTGVLEYTDIQIDDLQGGNDKALITKEYVDNFFGTNNDQVRNNAQLDLRYLPITNPSVNGNLTISGTPSSGSHVVDVDYVSRFLNRTTSGSINGTLAISAPTSGNHATTKTYVDNAISDLNAIRSNGGNQSINGRLTISDPAAASDATTKRYVDNKIAGINFPDLSVYATETWVTTTLSNTITNDDTNMGSQGLFIPHSSTSDVWRVRQAATNNVQTTWTGNTISHLDNRYTHAIGSTTVLDMGSSYLRVRNLQAQNNSTFTTASFSGKTTVNAELEVNSHIDLNGTLNVSSTSTMSTVNAGSTTVTGLNVTGNSTLSSANGTANAQGNLSVGQDIILSNTSELRIGSSSVTYSYMSWGNNHTTNHYGNFNVVAYSGAPGNVIADNDVIGYLGTRSDKRLKERIVLIDNALDKVSKLKGVTYTLKETGERKTGLIAQDVEAVLPEAVFETPNKYLGEDAKHVYYGETVGLLVEAIKELKAEVDELKQQLKK